ncbi:methyltransferase [Ekhidna sp. To15]|uniref:methyltransferase n=1 Tax=Ekhidna sp. To15 TaxID=3395267 RepID=UPI003F51D2F3
MPEVFHPGFFFSTKYLLEFLLENRSIPKKKILELGAGSGLISTYLAKEGGEVYASDINSLAVENVKLNAQMNGQQVTVYCSDLFDDIPQTVFDYILINPPYYPKKPTNNEEKAWYCGEDFEYFQKLFAQLSRFVNKDSEVFMVLSEDCDLQKIEGLANQDNWSLSIEDNRVFIGEQSTIYHISLG